MTEPDGEPTVPPQDTLEASGLVVEFTTRSGAVARALDGVDVQVRW